MALGAGLVSDDRVVLTTDNSVIMAAAPPTIQGLIEARGVGLLNAAPVGPVPVLAVLDLDRVETERLPRPEKTILLGQTLTLLHKVESPHFNAALMQYLKAGRQNVE